MQEHYSKKSQHFVPKFYLKRFTFDGKYCYTKNKSGQIHEQKIQEICKTKNGYEIKNKFGNIINKNYVEEHLATLDDYFDKFLIRLVKYLDSIKNGDTINFAANMEKQALMLFITITILRNNKIIDETKNILKNQFNILVDEQSARNRGIKNIFELSTEWANKLNDEYSVLIHRNITNKEFITCDIPITIIPLSNLHMFYLPLSPIYFVILIPNSISEKMGNVLIENKNLDVSFFNSFFSYKMCEKVSISNNKNNFNI